MGIDYSHNAKPRSFLENKIRICLVSSVKNCDMLVKVIDEIVFRFPDKYESWYYFDSGSKMYNFTIEEFDNKLNIIGSAPLIWIENNSSKEVFNNENDFKSWVKDKFNFEIMSF